MNTKSKYGIEIRKRIIYLFKSDHTFREIAAELRMPLTSVAAIIRSEIKKM